MTLYLIGLGIGDKTDITVKGLEIIRSADLVFLENYTAILPSDKYELEKFYGKSIIIADRDLVEKEAEKILNPSKTKKVAFLVVGDPFGATTHTDLYLRAKNRNIKVEIINNSSILNAIGQIGLELYKYGPTISIVFPEKNWKVETHYEIVKENLKRGLHTLCLLDIKVKEPRKEDLLEGKNEALKPRFMNVNEGLRNLMNIEKKRKENIFSSDTLVVGIARLGQPTQLIKSGPIKEIIEFDFGEPLHSLIIPGKLHFMEEDMLKLWK